MDLLLLLLNLTATALIVTMVILIKGKSRTNTIALIVAVLLLIVGMFSAFDLISYAGLGAIAVVFLYLIPLVFMLNFTLFALVFKSITGDLGSTIKICTAISLISLGVFLLNNLLSSSNYRLVSRIFGHTVTEWFFGILWWVSAAFGAIGAIITHIVMLVYAIKFTQGQCAKRFWVIFAFLLPFVGSIIYLIVHFVVWLVKVLIKTKTNGS